MNLQLGEVATAVDGTLAGPATVLARGYSIDSRTVKAGDLFFAVKGPRFDGHDFLQQAVDKKASGIVIDAQFQTSIETKSDFGIIRLASPVEALRTLAKNVRRRWGKPIIGVTGSAGKTTTKEMIAAVLAKKFKVLRTIGNFNNEIGLPLTLLRLEHHQDMGVLEMGMSAKGEIRNLAAIAEPNEGLITNVNAVHLEFFKSVDEIAEAKAELLGGLVAPRIAYLNNDDPRVSAMARNFDGKIVTFGVKNAAAFKVQKYQDLGIEGSSFTVQHESREVKFVLPLPGSHNVTNALAAITVGVSHDVPWEEIRAAVAEFKPEKMRGQIVRFREGFVAVDDSYNSNPKALTEMIRFIGNVQGYTRKIIVAGEMLELGPESAALHQGCGKEAAKAGASLIVGVQGMAKEILEGARDAGIPADRLKFVPDALQAGEFLARTVKSGDIVLIKGSRGVKLEQALNTLRGAFTSLEP